MPFSLLYLLITGLSLSYLPCPVCFVFPCPTYLPWPTWFALPFSTYLPCPSCFALLCILLPTLPCPIYSTCPTCFALLYFPFLTSCALVRVQLLMCSHVCFPRNLYISFREHLRMWFL